MLRRSFLASAGCLVLVGCSSDADSDAQAEANLGNVELVPLEPSGPIDLVVMFSPTVLAAGIPQRLPFGLMRDGVFVLGTDGADEVTVRLVNETTQETASEQNISGRAVAHFHAEDTPTDHDHSGVVRYFAPTLTFPDPGKYRLVIESGLQSTEAGLTALAPSQVQIPNVGEAFPPLVTPTLSAAGGVDPLCTRSPACDFHTDTPAELLGLGQPFVLLVATPAFCQTPFCGPVLDLLIDVAPEFPNITFIHTEVYANPNEVDGNFADPALRVAPVMQELALEFEPTMFVVGSDGTIANRIDNVFDDVELREALNQLT